MIKRIKKGKAKQDYHSNVGVPKRVQDVIKLVSFRQYDQIDTYIAQLKEQTAIENGILKAKGKKIVRIDYEYLIQCAVATYMNQNYPEINFWSDDSGLNKRPQTGKIRNLLKKKGLSMPDFHVMKPNNGYSGLYIELKTADNSPFLKDGSVSTVEHTQEQKKSLESLSKDGYKAVFAAGFNEAIKIINDYLQ